MNINFGIFLLTITLLASFASAIDEIIVKHTFIEPEPFYHSRPIYNATLQTLLLYLAPLRMREFMNSLSSFPHRNANSKERNAERWLSQEIRTVLSHYKVGNAYLREIKPSNAQHYQKNLIGIVEGQDPNKKENLVILGAHYDTVPNPSGSSPGANDNASGCAVLMEVLRLIVLFGIKFKNTVEFHFYTGKEELKRFGSQDVISQYIKEGRIHHMMNNHEVKGMLNVDTIGGRNVGDYHYRLIGLCTRNDKTGDSVTNPHLTAFVNMLIRVYSNYKTYPLPVYDRGLESFSDNQSWHSKGYPSALLTQFQPGYGDLHEFPEYDTTSAVYDEYILEFTKVALAFAIELGELWEIPHGPFTTPNGLISSTELDGTEPIEASMAQKGHPTWTLVVLLTYIGIWMLY
ncbi:unnamed protein product [Orchesella dallaii]|uniref:Peptidase M28 domain-containing protein n=1 Tax=Orchesella dallaii TaxID=48710 RepID=A0ABP1RXQ5_9HEXA